MECVDSRGEAAGQARMELELMVNFLVFVNFSYRFPDMGAHWPMDSKL